MLKPSRETLVIRGLLDSVSDKELRRSSPKDFQKAVEDAGLDYKQVRGNVNNELARLRRYVASEKVRDGNWHRAGKSV